jgi:ABC-type branched-subunit amino acid transport system substrate-binding protein
MKKNYMFFFVSLFLLFNSALFSFSSIQDFIKYTNAYPEHPPMDNLDLFKPDYTTFYKSITPGMFSWIRQYFGLGEKTQFDSYAFKTLLNEITNHRLRQGLAGKKVVHIRCKPETLIYVWSNIHGDLHSLIRSMSFLYEEKIIDSFFKIIQPNIYFIFNGNLINGSAYTLESLYVILLLLKQNPNNVFYIRGNHESKDFWHNFNLKDDLEIRASHVSTELIPLNTVINNFFSTLPLAAYISIQGDLPNVLRISYIGRDDQQINEHDMANFFSKGNVEPITYYDTDSKKKSSTSVDIKAIIKTSDWFKDQHPITDLELLEQDNGSTAWSLFSAPTKLNQLYFKITHDNFILIELGKTLSESTFTLYQKDIQTKEDFKRTKTYNLITGAQEGTVFYSQEKKNDIFVGSTLSLELGVRSMGQQAKRGILTHINEINQTGGINGHLLRAIVYNDDYTPYLARRNIIHFMDQNITTIIAPVGSPTLAAYLDFIKAKKIAVLFPITGAPEFRSPELKGIVNWRTDYPREVTALINHIMEESKTHKFAFFYQDDAYGRGAAEAARATLKSKGITEWLDVPYTRASTDFQEHAHKIRTYQPSAIGLFSTSQATQELIRELGITALNNILLFAISFLGEKSFRQFIKSQGISVLFAAVVPNPNISELEIVKEYRAAMDNHRYYYDVFSLEAYIACSIMSDMLKKIDEPFTKDKLLAQLESLNNYHYKGLILTFNPEQRSLSQPVWIELGDKTEWIKYSNQPVVSTISPTSTDH